jgi:hypothetical protein
VAEGRVGELGGGAPGHLTAAQRRQDFLTAAQRCYPCPFFPRERTNFTPVIHFTRFGISDLAFGYRWDLWYVPTLRTFLLKIFFYSKDLEPRPHLYLPPKNSKILSANFPREFSPRIFPANFPREFSPRIFPANFLRKISLRNFPAKFPHEISPEHSSEKCKMCSLFLVSGATADGAHSYSGPPRGA